MYHTEVLIEDVYGLTFTNYGNVNDPIPVIDGDGTRPTTGLSGTGLTLGLVEIRDREDITMSNIRVIESKHSGIVVREESGQLTTDDVTVEYCEVHDTKGWGILSLGVNWNSGSAPGPATNIIIANCKVSKTSTNESSGEALTFRHVSNFWCYDNDVSDNYKDGIDVTDGCYNGFVYRNKVRDFHSASSYFTGGTGAGIYIDGNDSGIDDVQVYDNLVYDQGNGIQVGAEGAGDVDDVKVYNNVVYDVLWHNFKLAHGAGECTSGCGDRTNVKVHNNTFVGDTNNAIIRVLEPESESKISGFEVKNNICAREVGQTADMILQPSSFAESYYSYNLFYNNGDTINGDLGSSNVLDDPDFESETWS